MAIELKQSLKLTQQLLITPQLQQAIKLLQLSRHELIETIQQELVENPVLEESNENKSDSIENTENLTNLQTASETPETPAQDTTDKMDSDVQDFDWANYVESYSTPSTQDFSKASSSAEDLPNYENMVSSSSDLRDHLEWQVQMADYTEEEKQFCYEIIGNIDDNGYLRTSLEDIEKKSEFTYDELDDGLFIVQTLDPIGVGARNLQECLLLQIKDTGKDKKHLENIIKNHLNLVEKRDYPSIAKKLTVTVSHAKELITFIGMLEPKPGRVFASQDTQYVTPDIYIKEVGGEYVVVLNEDGMPKLQISNFYKAAIKKEIANRATSEEAPAKTDSQTEAQDYIQDKLKSALWLIKSIHQRQKTLYKVTKAIAKFQQEFFRDGVHNLKPLVLREIADEIGVHESTVSRATNGKYVHTPQGIFELKYFFNTGLSNSSGGKDFANEAVKQMVKELVSNENAKSPLSDQAIADYLKTKNVNIARRTIAKYREMLGILPSSKRKRLY